MIETLMKSFLILTPIILKIWVNMINLGDYDIC